MKRRNLATHGLVSEYADRFSRKQQENGALRFDDVTFGLQSLVGMRDANNRLMFRLDQQIEHLLLDEFQDTSPGQWQVIEPFAKWVSMKNSGRSFFCVGDMKQAIYAWRGGVAEIFDLVDSQLDNLETHPDLIKSFRSAPEIIETVNHIFQNLGGIKTDCSDTNGELKRASERFTEHQTSRTNLPGHATLRYGPDCDKALHRDPNKKLRTRNEAMLDQMVEQIAINYHGCPEYSIGVLTRTNKTVAEIIFRLQQIGIPASQEGGNALTDSAAVETILAVIQLADHPGDTVARFLVSHSPIGAKFGLLPESTQTRKQNAAAVPGLAARIRKQLIDEGYGPTVESLARMLADQCTERELSRLQKLVELSYDYEDSWTLRADQFVAYIRETKVPDETAARVRVMTVHGAKGLEFDIVFLPIPASKNWFRPPRFVVDREKPTDQADLVSLYVNKNLQSVLPDEFREAFRNEHRSKVRDELCVLYVALTRAVHAMHIFVSYECKPEQPKSFGGLLINALAPGKENRVAERVVFSVGSPEWYLNHEKEKEEMPAQLKEYYLPECAVIGVADISAERKSGRGYNRIKPSTQPEKTQLASVLVDQSTRESMHFGTLIHACFQSIQWLDEKNPPGDDTLTQFMKLADPIVSDEEVSGAISQFRKMLEFDEIKKLLALMPYRDELTQRLVPPTHTILEAFDLRVENERRIAVISDDGLMEGFIDRLVWLYEGDQLIGAEIIELKTDSVHGNSLADRVSRYKNQLEIYSTAVGKISGLNTQQVSTKLVFVGAGIVVDVSKDLEQIPKPGGKGETHSVPEPKLKSSQQLRLW